MGRTQLRNRGMGLVVVAGLLFAVIALSRVALPGPAVASTGNTCLEPVLGASNGGTSISPYFFDAQVDGISSACHFDIEIEALGGTLIDVPVPDVVGASTSRAVRFQSADVCRRRAVQRELAGTLARRDCVVEVLTLRAVDPNQVARAQFNQCLDISEFARLKSSSARATRETLNGTLVVKLLSAAPFPPRLASVVLRLKKPKANGEFLGQSSFVPAGPAQQDCVK